MTPPRDDDQVEYKPGRTIRRDVGIRLGLIAPEVLIGGPRPATPVPPIDPQPETVVPPPLQPSHEDFVSVTPKTATRPIKVERINKLAEDPDLVRRAMALVASEVTGPGLPIAAPRTRAPRPAKRSLDAILAEADRTHRALRRKAKP